LAFTGFMREGDTISSSKWDQASCVSNANGRLGRAMSLSFDVAPVAGRARGCATAHTGPPKSMSSPRIALNSIAVSSSRAECFDGHVHFALRLVPSRNNQQIGINWAEDFDFEARLTSLLGP
jgi:hypothetical protein